MNSRPWDLRFVLVGSVAGIELGTSKSPLGFFFFSLVVSVAGIEMFTLGSPPGSCVSVARIELGTLGEISGFD